MKKNYIKEVFLIGLCALILSSCSNETSSSKTTQKQVTKETEQSSSFIDSSAITTNSINETKHSEISSSRQVSETSSTLIEFSTNESILEEPSTTQSLEDYSINEQEESYEDLKQRTLTSTPSDRTNWSNKEWEAFGMALYENGLTLDESGNIISQPEIEQQNTDEEQLAEPTTLTDFVDTYGMSPVVYKMEVEGMSEEEALRNTPNEMKTSGEIQLGFLKYGIQ